MNSATLILLALKVSILLTVLGFALKTSLSEATHLFRHPRLLARAFIAMNVIMPVFAVTLALAFDLHPAVKFALVALSVSPIPPLLPKKTLKAGGKQSYTISLLAAAAVLAIVVVPLALELFERIFHLPLAMSPTAMATIVFSTVLAPLVAGVAVNTLAPNVANRLSRPVSIVAVILLVVSVLPVIVTAWPAVVSLLGDGALAAIAAFVIVGLMSGHALGGPDDEDRTALALATATRHPGVAIAIAQANFPGQKLALAAVLLYLVTTAAISIPYLKWTKRHHPEITPRGGGHRVHPAAPTTTRI